MKTGRQDLTYDCPSPKSFNGFCYLVLCLVHVFLRRRMHKPVGHSVGHREKRDGDGGERERKQGRIEVLNFCVSLF